MKAAAGLLFARGCMSLCALVSFILVGRHLSPQEFGVFALASSASLLPHLLVGAGFYEYVLGRDPDGQMTGTAATCAALSGGAAGVLLLLFAMLAWFQFGSRDAAAILVGFAVAAVLWGLVVIQEAVLVREGRGGAVAAVLSAGEIVGLAALALSFWAGAGILALAIYRLAGSLTTTLGYLLSARPGFRFRFDAAAAREMAGFSLGLMGGKVVDWVNGYGSDLLIGTFMPVAGVGVFRMGARMYLAGFAVIAQAPSAAVLSHLGRAAAASSARLRRATLQALRLQLVLATPVFVAVAALSQQFLPALLGAGWQDSGTVLAIFCLFAPVSIGSMTAGAVLLAQGHSGRLFRYQLVMMLPLAAAMAAGSLAGPAAVAAAKGGYAILYVLGLVAFAGALRRGGGREFLLTLPRVAAAAGLMAAWCLAWIHLLSPGQGLPLRLLLACGAVVTGTVIFAVALRFLDRPGFRLLQAMVRLGRRHWRRRRAWSPRHPAPMSAAVTGRAGT